MKASNQFITRVASDGSFVKVLLNNKHNVYPYFHNGIHFFIHKDYWSKAWNAIESQSGSSIVTDYHTKKECLKYALLRIDNVINLDKVIEHNIELTRSAKIMNMNDYIAIEG